MSAYTGLTASVKLGAYAGAETIAYISGVDLSLDKDIIEILAFGMSYKEKVPAIKDWNASIDGTLAIADGNTQKDIYDAFESGVALVIGVYLDSNDYFEGTCFVKSFKITTAPDDKINLTAELSGSGPLLLTLDGVTYMLGVDITGVEESGETLTAVLDPLGATVTYRWLISSTVNGSYLPISGATSATYVLVVGDVGKFIKVEATGTGSFTGVVLSTPTAEIGA